MEPLSQEGGSARESQPAWLRGWLGTLWGAWFVCLPGNLVAIGVLGREGLARWWFLSSVALSLAAGGHWLARRRTPAGRFALGIAVGMIFGCLADSYGALPKAWRVAETLAVIMPLFALGHVAYIAACWDLAGRLGLRRRGVWLASLAVWVLVGVGLWVALVTDGSKAGVYRWPALGYTVLLCATAGTTSALALQRRRFGVMALGAVLFLVSDAVLAVYLFYEASRALGVAVWITYGLGQMLIVYGAAAVSGLAAEPLKRTSSARPR